MLLSCLSVRLSFSDFLQLNVGTILDILIEHKNSLDEIENKKENNKGDSVRDATPNDNIMSFL